MGFAVIKHCLFLLLLVTGISSSYAAEPLAVTPQTSPIPQTQDGVDEGAPVFGKWLFNGDFAKESFRGFNPNYVLAIGDQIQLQLWGGYEFQANMPIDHQGCIFLPKVGPIKVAGITNDKLNDAVVRAVTRVYQKNVNVYATLDVSQPVKVFVTGFVKKPGLYSGQSGDSVLYFLDKAGGISPDRGSYLDVTLMRKGSRVASFDLYKFLLNGKMAPTQLRDGDTVVVGPLRYRVDVAGKVHNANRFELRNSRIALQDLLDLAQPDADATHVRINRNTGENIRIEYFPLAQAGQYSIQAGDLVDVVADKRFTSIAVRVEGEHRSNQEMILPYGARLGDVIKKLQLTPDADMSSLQLFRKSIKVRQKEMLNSSLKALEASILTARSSTKDEAALRTTEADLLMRWVDRAKGIEPKGQVVLAHGQSPDQVILEPDDVIHIPRKTNLVMVHGDVLFPNAILVDPKRTVEGYINMAGGFTQNDDNSRILLLHRDGTFSKVPADDIDDEKYVVNAGDEVFVVPKVDSKNLQITKDFTEVLYQIALSARAIVML